MRLTLGSAMVVAALLAWSGRAEAQGHFLRGDVNGNRTIDIADAIYSLAAQFTGGDPITCLDAADVNDTGAIDIADPIFLLNFLFLGGTRVAAPYPKIDADPTEDGLGCKGPCQEIAGTITSNMTLTTDKCYRLVGPVFVQDGVTLTIEPGVTVLGDTATDAYLVIDRGAKLMAVGEPLAPIIFTSDKPVGQRARSDWGGIVVLGRGDNNQPTKQAQAEGLPVGYLYGGGENVNPEDNSGHISYVRIEFGGTAIALNNEINGLSLFSVGSATKVDHVMIKYNSDDCIEWFGGSVDVKHAICIGMADDSFDYSFGWRGNGQYWVVQQRGDEADRAFEIDNSESEFTAVPLTRPTISNVTLIGDPDTNEGTGSTEGLYFRRGCGTVLYNAIVQGFKVAGLDIDDGVTTNNNPTNGNLVVDYCLFYENGPAPDRNRHFRTGETGTGGGGEETEANGFAYSSLRFGTELNTHNIQATLPPTVDPYNLINANFRPQNQATSSAFNPSTLGSFFEPASYYGAVPPTGEDWTQAAWTSYSQN